eukprot:scaffold39887_cov229-Amphora_coffeaeformis.AAC.5
MPLLLCGLSDESELGMANHAHTIEKVVLLARERSAMGEKVRHHWSENVSNPGVSNVNKAGVRCDLNKKHGNTMPPIDFRLDRCFCAHSFRRTVKLDNRLKRDRQEDRIKYHVRVPPINTNS